MHYLHLEMCKFFISEENLFIPKIVRYIYTDIYTKIFNSKLYLTYI